MTNKEKLRELKLFLRRKGIRFKENFQSKKVGIEAELYIPYHRIVVRVSDEKDQEFYETVKYCFRPFFIREEESIGFIIEKMKNCLRGQTISDSKFTKMKKYEKNEQ